MRDAYQLFCLFFQERGVDRLRRAYWQREVLLRMIIVIGVLFVFLLSNRWVRGMLS